MFYKTTIFILLNVNLISAHLSKKYANYQDNTVILEKKLRGEYEKLWHKAVFELQELRNYWNERVLKEKKERLKLITDDLPSLATKERNSLTEKWINRLEHLKRRINVLRSQFNTKDNRVEENALQAQYTREREEASRELAESDKNWRLCFEKYATQIENKDDYDLKKKATKAERELIRRYTIQLEALKKYINELTMINSNVKY